MTLFIDMDEVLADTYSAHISRYNQDYEESLSITECLGSEVWQKVPADRQWSVRKHASTHGFFRDLVPIEDSREIVKELAGKYQVFIASAAMQFPNSLIEKSDWLDEHFPFIPWKNRILCGDKHILRGDILIDDRSYNLDCFAGRSILFTSPHNIHAAGYERADTWQDIANKLL